MGENDTPRRRRRPSLAVLLLLVVFGAVLAIALNESARSTLLDLMFGAEEEFDYTAVTDSEASNVTPDGAAV